MKITRKIKIYTFSLIFLSCVTIAPVQAYDMSPSAPPCSLPYSILQSGNLDSLEHELQCGRIPASLLIVPGRVNLSKFTIRFQSGKLKDAKYSWHIERDYANHGGSYWKLYDPRAKIRHSLDRNGKVIKDY